MKKFLSILLTVMLMLSVIPLGLFSITASAATSGKTGDCTWSLDGTVLTISGNGKMEDYWASYSSPWGASVTEVIIKTGVTSIGNYAFWDCEELASVTIPDSVTSIGNYAFEGCIGLTSITIPNSVTSIGSYAFDGCTGLTSITIPDSVTSIGKYAFKGCIGLENVYINSIANWCNIGTHGPAHYNLYLNGKLVKDLVIPNSVTSINDSAFSGCIGLTSVTIPDSVTDIGRYAFSKCTELTSITIPDSVKKIGIYAFVDCEKLEKVNITDLSAWCSLDFFYWNNYCKNPLFYAENLYLNGELVTNLIIPDNVTSIGSGAFVGCRSITSVTIPSSVKNVGKGAFIGCNNIELIIFDEGTTAIQADLFESSSKIKKIYIPKSITVIYNNAFAKANNITDIYYGGIEEEWKNVVIQHSNGSLATAMVHYNCTGLPEYTPGDLDGDEGITDSDVLYLLKHTFRPEKYPVNQPCDYNGDGEITDADAVYLLKHIFRPEKYPLTK